MNELALLGGLDFLGGLTKFRGGEKIFCSKSLVKMNTVLTIGAKKYFFRVAEFFQKKFRLGFFCNVSCSAPRSCLSIMQ